VKRQLQFLVLYLVAWSAIAVTPWAPTWLRWSVVGPGVWLFERLLHLPGNPIAALTQQFALQEVAVLMISSLILSLLLWCLPLMLVVTLYSRRSNRRASAA
jgi:hypothetical protein